MPVWAMFENITEQPLTYFIDGLWVAPFSTRMQPVLNPLTGAEITQVVCADARDVERAVAAAARAPHQGRAERAALLRQVRDALERRAAELAALNTLEAGVAPDMRPMTAIFDRVQARDVPVGDVSALLPGPQHALADLLAGVAQVIAWGGSCVICPPRQAPLSAILAVDILSRAGVPPGVINLVHGDAARDLLAVHPAIAGRIMGCPAEVSGIS